MDFYSYDKIDKTKALYRIVIGERSNGKSYGFKKKCIDNFLQTGKQFGLIRRFEDDVKPALIQAYFGDMDDYLKQELKNAYPQYKAVYIEAKQGKFTIKGIDDDNIKYDIGIMGYYFSLNTSIRAKGSQFPDITIIGFEEFMTRERELTDEFSRFINLVSTIIRKRSDVVIYLLGNTVNRRSQLLASMNINVTQLKQGEITMFYTYHDNGDIANKIAVEYCRHYDTPKESEAYFRFNNPREAMIINGEWEVDDYPKFDKEELYSEKIMSGFVFEDSSVRLYGYVTDKGMLYISNARLSSRCNYITLTVGDSHFERRIFNWRCNVPRINNLIKKLLWLKTNGKIRYTDNIVGDDFRNFLLECNKIRTS